MEFFEPSEARIAFTRLAYTKFKSLPLYLEWAPDNSFANSIQKTESSTVETKKEKIDNNNENKNKNETKEIKEETESKDQVKKEDDDHDGEDDDEPEPDTTLFVKNLNFSTTDKELKTVN